MIRLSNLGAYAMLPVRVLHEATHVATGYPWARSWGVDVGRDRLTTRIDFAPGTPRWAVVLTHLAPTVVGVLVGLVVLALVATGGLEVVVRTPLDALWLAVAGWAWWAYAWPSQRDRNPQRTRAPAGEVPGGND